MHASELLGIIKVKEKVSVYKVCKKNKIYFGKEMYTRNKKCLFKEKVQFSTKI